MPGTPRVHVGPEPAEPILAAVRRAGGELVAPEEAEAIVWLDGPDGLAPLLSERVRWVQLPSAGVEHWLQSGVLDDERVWTSATGAYARQVAEHALALVLAGRRRLAECARATRWADLAGRPLAGASVAVVGAGGIGRALLAMLAPHGVRTIAVRRSGRDVPGADESVAAAELGAVWPRAEVCVLAAPATDATRHLVGEAELAALPEGAVLVNVARGSLVDTDALVRALRSGRLGAACLDVTDPEPLPDDHPLWREERALVTPHTANPPAAMLPALAERVAENVARFARGEALVAPVEVERGY
jgi:D-3-phosphoglycerate dehydrogenase